MATIFSFVHTYLLQHEGIVIEDLGALLTTYKASEYSGRYKKLLPPRKIITFSEKTKHRDNHFIDYIAKQLNVSTEEAGKEYDHFCNQVKRDLSEKGEVTFPVAGKLVKKELLYLFQQTPGFTCYGPSLGHGLVAVKTDTPTGPEPQRATSAGKRQLLRWVAGIAAVLAVLLVVYAALFTTLLAPVKQALMGDDDEAKEALVKKERVSSLTKASVDSLAASDSVAGYIVEHLEKTTEPRQALYFEATDADTLSNKEMRYFLIAGSFRQRANAQKFQATLKQKGYASKLMVSEKELYRIALDSFRSEDTALNVLARIRAKGDIESVWLLNAVNNRR